MAQVPVRALIAPGADPVSPATMSFTDITGDVEAGEIRISVGRPDEGSRVAQTQANASIKNSSGNYSRVNPLGLWYGQLDKGSPLEFRIRRIVDTFTRSTGSGWGTEPNSGMTWVHSNTARWQATGSAGTYTSPSPNTVDIAILDDAAGHDVEVLSTASVPAVMTGAAMVHATVVRYTDNNNYYRLNTEFHLAGSISVKIVRLRDGVPTELTGLLSTGVTYSAGTRIRTRVRAVGPTLQIRCWLESGSEPTTWHATVNDTEPLTGTTTGVLEWRVAGNTNAGSVTITVDDWQMDNIRSSTPVPEWPVRWGSVEEDVTVPVTGAGPLRRLAQGQAALRSPIYRQLIAQPASGYWPLEDSGSATSAASAVVRGRPASLVGASTGSSDCPGGAAAAVTLNTLGTSRITGSVARWSGPQDGYSVMCYLRFPTLPAASPARPVLSISAPGSVARWVVTVDAATLNLTGYDFDGAVVASTPGIFYGLDATKWWAIQLETIEDTPNNEVDWAISWHQVGSETFFGSAGTYTGIVNQVDSVTVTAPVDGTLVSHLWVGRHTLPFVDTTFMQVSSGYSGEPAGDRLARLCTENGVPIAVLGDPDDTAPMGPQRPGILLDLLYECEQADQGILHERGPALAYLTRASRYNQTPTMTLDFDSRHIGPAPEPTDDDQRLRNRIVLSRPGGGSATAEDTASIARNGVYLDELTANVQTDDQLEQHAAWRLHLGTIDGLRWPRIELTNLASRPDLATAWCKVRIGSRITIAHPPAAVGVEDLDLVVEGWAETFTNSTWRVVLVCSPAKPWDVAVYDSASRYDSATTVTTGTLPVGTVGQTGVSLAVATSRYRQSWSTTAVPYVCSLAGEWVTVTAATTPSFSGGTWNQTLTLTRGANGFVKSHAAGEQVRLAVPARYAL